MLVLVAVSYTFYAPQFDDKSLSQGDIAGVQVVSSSGQPGSSATIQIRGVVLLFQLGFQ